MSESIQSNYMISQAEADAIQGSIRSLQHHTGILASFMTEAEKKRKFPLGAAVMPFLEPFLRSQFERQQRYKDFKEFARKSPEAKYAAAFIDYVEQQAKL